MTLKDTVKGMLSDDYKERFLAEYFQTKIRYEKLKALNTKIEAADLTNGAPSFLKNMLDLDEEVEMPDHECPADLLREQQEKMGEYLHLLELRAVIEKIDLEEE